MLGRKVEVITSSLLSDVKNVQLYNVDGQAEKRQGERRPKARCGRDIMKSATQPKGAE